jgi:dGTPase
VVKLADVVAYINHDIGDAIRAGIITEDELPHPVATVLGQSHSERINTLVCDIVDYSWAATGLAGGDAKPVIGMSAQILEAVNILREFLFERVYDLRSAQEETEKAREVVRFLYHYFIKREDRLPQEYVFPRETVEQRVVDYIAGMTDQYALRIAEEISPPREQMMSCQVI